MMVRHVRRAIRAWFVVLLSAGAALGADQSATKKKPVDEELKFIRVTRDADETPTALQTAIVRYAVTNDDGEETVVDLIGVVHIGEREYYRQLNDQFKQYDAVLYELVAPEGTRVPKEGAKSSHPIGHLQMAMKSILELNFQLEHIDYHKKNLVHADMSPEDFSKSMEDRGESIWQILLRMMAQGMVQQGKTSNQMSDADLLMALFDRNRALALKRLLAQQFEDLDGAMAALSGPNGSTLITERNKKALKVLQQKIDSGAKRLAIFYGAGHMPDMSERLENDFGLKRGDEQWLTAWDLRSKPEKPASKSVRKPAGKPSGKQDKQEKPAKEKAAAD